jgi:hypothetical protein
MSRSHLHVLPGGRHPDALVPGRGHVTNLRPAVMPSPTVSVPETRLVFLTDLELDLTLAVLEAHTAQSVRDVAATIREQQNRRRHPSIVECDPTPAHGIPRPNVADHQFIPQVGSNMCICGQPRSTHGGR